MEIFGGVEMRGWRWVEIGDGGRLKKVIEDKKGIVIAFKYIDKNLAVVSYLIDFVYSSLICSYPEILTDGNCSYQSSCIFDHNMLIVPHPVIFSSLLLQGYTLNRHFESKCIIPKANAQTEDYV